MGRPVFSRLSGGLRIGAEFFARRGAVLVDAGSRGRPRGVVDRLADLANPGLDVARVHPAIVAFFEDTAGLELLVRSHWRFPFSAAWRVGRGVMRGVGQFVLPLSEGRILTKVLPLDAARDGRRDARAVIRTYADDGRVMQAVAYATWERDDSRYMSACFPMPLGQITGILRLDPTAQADDGRITGVALTSARRRGDDAGVWLVVAGVALPAPFGERLDLWAAGEGGAPDDLDPAALPGATIVGRHEQTLFGVRFVTHNYWFRPLGVARS